jgi:hypothetical protein
MMLVVAMVKVSPPAAETEVGETESIVGQELEDHVSGAGQNVE